MEENQLNEIFNFRDTEATAKVFELTKRIRAVCGGTSASKTISILVWIIDYCQSNRNKKFDVMSESYPHLEDGAIKDFRNIMIDRGYWRDESWNESKHFYTFESGTVLKFISVDKLGKAHGPRRDGLFINEANNIKFEIYDQLEVRTKDVVWLDWNPVTEFWYYTEISGKVDHDFLRLTYLDCLNVLPQSIIDSIESKKNRKGWWKVYGEGQLGEVEGRIYKGWEIVDEIPIEARLERCWLDYGYSNDPTAAGRLYRHNGAFYLDEIIYQKGLLNKHIADVFLNLEEPAPIAADSAEPKSNDELAAYGLVVLPAAKGKDSVNHGIQVVQQQKIFVTRRSVNIIKEYRNYLWEVDKDGKVLNVPSPTMNHHMDGIRYAIASLVDFVPNNIRREQENQFARNQFRQGMNSAK